MELYDLLLAKTLGGGGGGGGGGGDTGKFTLLKTVNLGEIVYTSSTNEEVGTYTVNIDGCMGVLFSITREGEDPPMQVHVASYAFAFVYWSGAALVGSISGYRIYGRMDNSKNLTMGASTMGDAVYAGDASVSNNVMTFKVYKKYGSYGRINGTYTLKVYGVKYYDKDTKTPIL